MRSIWLAALIVAVIRTGTVSAQTPTLSHSIPSALAPGKRGTLTFYGTSLGVSPRLWTSFPAETVLARHDRADQVSFDVTAPADLAPGIVAVRVIHGDGASNLLPLMIDDLPTEVEGASHKTLATAQPIAFGSAVDGACTELAFDYYKFEGKMGQRISLEVVGARLGSKMDPVVRLLDPSGRELIQCDDDPAVAPDCRFSCRLPADGTYTIELRDVGYEGGPQHRYHLRLGDFPLTAAAFPVVGKRGATGEFHVLGRAVEGVGPISLRLEELGWSRIGVKYGQGTGSGFVRILASDSDETVESEPNESPAQAQAIALPCTVSGRFERAADRDCFGFAAKKGQKLEFRAATRSLGSPCDVALQILKADGAAVARSKAADSGEASVVHSFANDGAYVVAVEEINGRGSAELFYRLTAGPAGPGFSLTLDEEKIDIRPGGEVAMKVTAVRRDYKGEIAISVQSEGLELDLSGGTIGEGKTEAQIKLKAPAGIEQGIVREVKVVGKAAGSEGTVVASTATALKKVWPRLLYPPAEWDGVVTIHVK
jgi:hypothetical protein